MQQLPVIQPLGSPSCWGQKYQDGDVECGQCRFNDSCRKEVLRGAMNAPLPNQIPMPPRPQMPMMPPQQWPAPAHQYQPQPPTVPLPTQAFRPALPSPVQYQPQQPIPVPVQPMYPGYQHQPQQPMHYALPMMAPDPMQPWARPGANAPAYYFNQYPGESPVQRITKNLILRAVAAIAQELLGFFVQWTWPPNRNN